jgi:argininosuccinate synthase
MKERPMRDSATGEFYYKGRWYDPEEVDIDEVVREREEWEAESYFRDDDVFWEGGAG